MSAITDYTAGSAAFTNTRSGGDEDPSRDTSQLVSDRAHEEEQITRNNVTATFENMNQIPEFTNSLSSIRAYIRSFIPRPSQISYRSRPLTINKVLREPENMRAFDIQSFGTVNIRMCAGCNIGQGPFSQCVSMPPGSGQNGQDISRNECGNCHYGRSGPRCSFRPDGGTLPRLARNPILRTNSHKNIHFGRDTDLNSANGITNAISELKLITRSLRTRLRTLTDGHSITDIISDSEDEA